MEQKEHLFNKLMLIMTTLCCLVAQSSCNSVTSKKEFKKNDYQIDYEIDISLIPKDTLSFTEGEVTINNGLYYVGNEKYSGIVSQNYSNKIIKSYTSVFEGNLHGTYKSFYENGLAHEVRNYKNGFATGKHYSYWNNEEHNLKFCYNYYEEKREGIQEKWYPSGQPYISSNYQNDKEIGLQRAWRENGKLYINYIAKNGRTYGLQRTVLCYELIDEKLKQ